MRGSWKKKQWKSRLPGDGRDKTASNCKMRRMNEKIIVKANKASRAETRGGEDKTSRSLISSQEHKQTFFFVVVVVFLLFPIVIVVVAEQRRVWQQHSTAWKEACKHISKMPDDKIKCQMAAHYSNVMIVWSTHCVCVCVHVWVREEYAIQIQTADWQMDMENKGTAISCFPN